MQARYYDPVIGRFYSNDPVGFTGEVDTFNRYSYVANNPYKYTDPTGMSKEFDERQKQREKKVYDKCEKDSNCTNLIPKSEVTSALEAFVKNYEDMKSANTKGADKYFHCKANCEATKLGILGWARSHIISAAREMTDLYRPSKVMAAYEKSKNVDRAVFILIKDMQSDMEANALGRKFQPALSCPVICNAVRPPSLDKKY